MISLFEIEGQGALNPSYRFSEDLDRALQKSIQSMNL
jgi:hypothetical protein